MKNWVVKLLLLLFIPSLVEFCSPLLLVLIRVVGYKLRRMLYLRYSLSPEGLLSLLQDGKFLFLY